MSEQHLKRLAAAFELQAPFVVDFCWHGHVGGSCQLWFHTAACKQGVLPVMYTPVPAVCAFTNLLSLSIHLIVCGLLHNLKVEVFSLCNLWPFLCLSVRRHPTLLFTAGHV